MCPASTSQFPKSADAGMRTAIIFVYGFSRQKWRDTQPKHVFSKYQLHCTLVICADENKTNSTFRKQTKPQKPNQTHTKKLKQNIKHHP